MTTVYDPLYCDEPFLDDVPLPIEEEEDDAWFRVQSPPKYISPGEAERIRRRVEAEEWEEKRLWVIRAPMRARMETWARIQANPNAACKRRLNFEHLVGLELPPQPIRPRNPPIGKSLANSAPQVSPTPAPEIPLGPQPTQVALTASPQADKPKSQSRALPKRTTRAQAKAARAKAAKTHGLDASLILETRLRARRTRK